MTARVTTKELKQKMGFSRKLDLRQVKQWLNDHSYEMKQAIYAEQWASTTGRLSTDQELKLRSLTPAQYINLAAQVVNSVDYFSVQNVYQAWRKALS